MISKFGEGLCLYDLPLNEVASYLDEIEDLDGANSLRALGGSGQGLLPSKKYLIASHHIGFIEPVCSTDLVSVCSASTMKPDENLVRQTIKVTLDKFRVEAYPGAGSHRVLLEMVGRSQTASEAEDLRFATVVNVNDRDTAAVLGIPIFTGLQVPSDGLALEFRTINVSSSTDDLILDALQSSAFRDGLKVLGMVQPVLPQLVSLAGGVTATLVKRRRNTEVQRVGLGLDFSSAPTNAKLRIGSYVIVQAPSDGSWDWADWSYKPSNGTLVSDSGEVAPFNTVIFSVTASDGNQGQSAARPIASS